MHAPTQKKEPTNNKPASAQRKVSAIPQKKKVTHKVVSRITRDTTKYYKCFSYHYPAKFHVWINNQIINEKQPITIEGNRVTVAYTYQWNTPWGVKKGGKQVTFELPDELTETAVSFGSWDDEERISIRGAKKVSAEKLIEYHD
jgi:hypothetical protein